MAIVRNIAVRIGAEIDALTAAFRRGQSEARDFKKQFEGLGTGMTDVGKGLMTAISLPVAAMGVLSVKNSAIFEKSMDKVSALSGATGKSLDELTEKAREMGKTTSKTATESAEAMQYMALAGWNNKRIMESVEPILRLSEAGNLDLARASDLVTDSMEATGIQTNQLSEYLDKLAQSSRSSNTEIDQMMEAYNEVGGQFRNLKTPLTEASTWLGVLASRSIKGSEAGTSLSSILVNLTSGAGKAGKAIERIGLDVFDAEGNFRGITTVMKELRDLTNDMSEEDRTITLSDIGGKTQINTLNAMLGGINELDGEFDTLYNTIDKSDGALKEMYKTMQDNLIGQIDKMKSSLESVSLDLGNILLPHVKKLVSGISWLSDSFGKLPDKIKLSIFGFAAIAAIIPVLIFSIGTFITSLVAIAGAFAAITAPIIAFSIGIGAIIAVSATYTTAFVAMYMKNEDFRKSITNLKDSIFNKFGQIINFFKSGFSKIKSYYNAHKESIDNFAKSIISVFTTTAEMFTNIINEDFGKAFESFIKLGRNFNSIFIDILMNIIPEIGRIATVLYDKIDEKFMNFIDNLGGKLDILNIIVGTKIDSVRLKIIEKLETIRSEAPKKIEGFIESVNLKMETFIKDFPRKAEKLTNDFINVIFGEEDNKKIEKKTDKATNKIIETVEKKKPTIMTSILKLVIDIIKELGKLSIKVVPEIGKFIGILILTIAKNSPKIIFEIGKSIINAITEKLSELTGIGNKAGKSFIDSIKAGFDTKVASLKSGVSKVVETIANFFPRSPAKEGALKNIPTWGEKIIEQLSNSLMKSSPVLKAAANSVSKNAIISFATKKDTMTSMFKDFKKIENEAYQATNTLKRVEELNNRINELRSEKPETEKGKNSLFKNINKIKNEIKEAKIEGNQNFIKRFSDDSKKYMDEFSNNLESKITSVLNMVDSKFESFSLFEKVEKSFVSKSSLIGGLKTQVKTMNEYSQGMEILKTKLGETKLYSKFLDYGVKSVGELKAVNAMSEAQLKEYVKLFDEKYKISKDMTQREYSQEMTFKEKVRDLVINITGNTVSQENDITKLVDQVAEKLAYEGV